MNPDFVYAMAAIVGPLVGAGAGSYFGLKGALNGMREGVKRIDATVSDIRDRTRDVEHDIETLREDFRSGYCPLRNKGA